MDGRSMCALADQELASFLSASELETAHHRMCKQENKCGFGLKGLCCRLCSNGPCRITKNADRGVCGATADVIAAREFLRAVAAGSAAYLHLTEQAAMRLARMAAERKPLPGTAALERLANRLQFTDGDLHHRASRIARAVLDDLSGSSGDRMQLWEALIGKERRSKWHALGLEPGGAKSEILDALVKTGTNLNSDAMNMMLHCLRLGIVTGCYGLMLTNMLNDIMLGEPAIHEASIGLGVMDPSAVNILMTGHQPALFREVMERIDGLEGQQLAKSVGASRISLVGCTCVGQDMRARSGRQSAAFCGHAGNNFTSEAILMTGCVDLVLSEFNCTLPGIDSICEKLDISQLCLDGVAKTARAGWAGDPEERAKDILQIAAEAFKRRTASGARTNPMQGHIRSNTTAGISEYSLKQFLGGSWQPLIQLLKAGAIRGVAGVVGCSNLRTLGHDVFTVELAKELIAKDILVLSAGCTGGGLASAGLMEKEAAALAGDRLKLVCESLGIPPVLDVGSCLGIGRIETIAAEIAEAMGVGLSQLPVVISAPQWLEGQALADGAFALALGFALHLGSAPFVTGSPLVVDVLTNQMQALTGGRLMIEENPKEAAHVLSGIIEEKRRAAALE